MTDADYYGDLINRLLGSRKYEWCRPTLEGILNTITATQTVTPKQKTALDHIIVGRLKHDVGPV